MSNSFEEDVLKEAGWGCYQKFLIGLSAAYMFCSGFAYVSLYVILPIANCDLLFTEEEEICILCANTLGMLMGGWFLGTITDVIERIKMISVTLLVIFVSNFVLGFTTEFILFSVCSFFTGVGMAGNLLTVKVNLAEQLPVENRGACIVFLDLFWYAAYLISAGSLLHPNPRHPVTNRPKQTWNFISWRIMAGISAGLCLMASFSTALLQPNVRSLLTKRRRTTAHNFLKFIYAVNNSDHAEKYKLSVRQLIGYIKEFSVREPSTPLACRQTFVLRAKRCRTTYGDLMNLKHLKVLALVVALRSALAGDFLVHSIWLGRNIQKQLEGEGSVGCNVSREDIKYIKTESCSEEVNGQFFTSLCVFAAAAFLVLLTYIFLIDFIGRKAPLMFAYVICGASCLIFGFVKSYILCMVFSLLYLSCFAIIDNTLDVVIIENIPTIARGTAFGISYVLKYVCDILVKVLLFAPCRESFLFTATVMLTGGMLSYFLPDLKRKPMVE